MQLLFIRLPVSLCCAHNTSTSATKWNISIYTAPVENGLWTLSSVYVFTSIYTRILNPVATLLLSPAPCATFRHGSTFVTWLCSLFWPYIVHVTEIHSSQLDDTMAFSVNIYRWLVSSTEDMYCHNWEWGACWINTERKASSRKCRGEFRESS